MAHVSYSGLQNPDEVIEKMYEFLVAKGFTVAQPLRDDVNIFDKSTVDGKQFVILDTSGDYFVSFRSSNGTQIFGITDDAAMDLATKVSANNNSLDTQQYRGIGMTISEGYSSLARWYNQFRVPVNHNGLYAQGIWMPMPRLAIHQTTPIEYNKTQPTFAGTTSTCKYTLHCNCVLHPGYTVLFSLVKEDSEYYQVTHMGFGYLNKYDSWIGGIFMTGSANQTMINSYKVYNDFDPSNSANHNTDSYILPILSSSNTTTTYLRINIEEAISDWRGNIYWASSGTDNITGKKLSLPIRTSTSTNGEIPHFWYLQSHGRLDWGRNINTLNCITVNMPLYFAIQVDPDMLNNFSAVGVPSGIYFCCMLNMQTGHTYEISYPDSNDLCQVFPMGRRRGGYGYDGIAFRQKETDDTITLAD